MPACLNDSKRHFKGTEPSPKGRGYCAHAEPVHKRRKGTDGRMWCVKAYTVKGKRVKRWVRVAPAKKKASKSKSRK